jgi:hypothetical protein
MFWPFRHKYITSCNNDNEFRILYVHEKDYFNFDQQYYISNLVDPMQKTQLLNNI